MSWVFGEEQSKNVSKEVKRDSTDPRCSHCDLLSVSETTNSFTPASNRWKPQERCPHVSSTQLRQINDLALSKIYDRIMIETLQSDL